MLEKGILTLKSVINDGEWKTYLYESIQKTLRKYAPLQENQAHEVTSGIEDSLGEFVTKANYMLFESEYNESAWKDMLAIYYINNANIIKTTVMRVHLFKGDKEKYDLTDEEDQKKIKDNYLGYFNIRPIIDKRACVSYAMLNYACYKLSYYDEQSQTNIPINMITYNRNVHICGFTIPIMTFPYFGRDNKIVVCAQADMLMMSRFIYRKLHMPELTLRHICQSTSRDRLDIFPTKGISDRQILDIFFKRDITVRYYSGSFYNTSFGFDSDYYSLTVLGQLVLSYLDSNLPVFLAWKQHIVILNGISRMMRAKDTLPPDRVIAIYDDSGALIKELSDDVSTVMPIPFLGLCSWQDIESMIERNIKQYNEITQEKKTGLSYTQNDISNIQVIVPVHQRITMDYSALVDFINSAGLLKMHDLPEIQFELDMNDPNKLLSCDLWRKSRVFLVDCNTLKKRLVKLEINLSKLEKLTTDTLKQFLPLLDGSDKEMVNKTIIQTEVFIGLHRIIIQRILSMGIPQYYWCLEIPEFSTNRYLYFFFNASPAVPNDTTKVCLNFIPMESIIHNFTETQKQHMIESGFLKDIDIREKKDKLFLLTFDKPIITE